MHGELPVNASVSIGIRTASIDTRLEARDVHLRAPDFLDTDAFPEITFVGTRIVGGKEAFALTGDLTMRPITRPITLDVRYEGSGKDPWGGERMGFSATCTFDRREFGLRWNEALESGGVLVGNEIRIGSTRSSSKSADGHANQRMPGQGPATIREETEMRLIARRLPAAADEPGRRLSGMGSDIRTTEDSPNAVVGARISVRS